MIANLRACALVLVLLLSTVSSTWAADQTVILELGAGSVFQLERPFEEVLVDATGVVKVHTLTESSVILEPLNLGTSTLVFLDDNHVVIANIRIMVCNVIRTEYRVGPDCD
jgi:Flp pilus assembly secretin CpaC